MELTNDQVALLAGLGAIAASIMLMSLSYYLGQSARRRASEGHRAVVPAEQLQSATQRRSKAA